MKFVLGSPDLEEEGRRSTPSKWDSLHCKSVWTVQLRNLTQVNLDTCYSLLSVFIQIVRPGGMERPTDSYKQTHNLTLSLEDTLFGGQVSNLQVMIDLTGFI